MKLLGLKGTSALLGLVDLDVPEGLVAVVGRDERPLRELEATLRGAFTAEAGDLAPQGVVARVQGALPNDVADSGALSALWAGPSTTEPAEVLELLASSLARLRGAARVDRALDLLRGSKGEEGRQTSDVGAEDRSLLRLRIRELEGSPETLGRLERELADLRGDHAELAGDLEVATMAWLRERQDAETHLQAYRDRARELKVRLNQLESAGSEAPCPTCGRVLGSHYADVVATLREEWESVVQDGSWWRRRREQLELKPEALQELEGRGYRLQAATGECAERVERSRARVQDLQMLRRRLGADDDDAGDGVATDEDGGSPGRTVRRVLRNVRFAMVAECREELLEAGSRLASRLTGCRVIGLSLTNEGTLRLEGAESPLSVPAEEDRAAAVLALRLAGAHALLDWGQGRVESLVVGAPFDRLDGERQLRVVDDLRGLVERVPQVLLLTRSRVVDAYPEAFHAVLEIRSEPEREGSVAGPAVRQLVAGVGTLHIG